MLSTLISKKNTMSRRRCEETISFVGVAAIWAQPLMLKIPTPITELTKDAGLPPCKSFVSLFLLICEYQFSRCLPLTFPNDSLDRIPPRKTCDAKHETQDYKDMGT